ncbi:alpha/beta fold hydrolase [Streptomyces chilikensis]|uniref:Alpha/beta fold hydrolase n=1 Tax=Streptomyces chilikensis TaxID=1194079 RepID=A0ABV3EI77_9ACTN
MPESAVRTRPELGHYVSETLRDRYLAACDAAFALGAPVLEELDVETSFATTRVYRHGPADAEAPDRTPVVLLHGAGSCSAMWYTATPALSAERPVYAIDTPGDAGRSVQREDIHRPEHSARWLDETLAGLGLDRVHLVGASYGGWLALNQAHLRPERLASVTALDPGGLEKVGPRFFVWIFAGLFASFAPRRLRPRLAALLDQPVLVMPELRAMVQTGARAWRTRRPSPLPLSDEELAAVRVPLHLVLGRRSPLMHAQAQAERVPRLVPGARVVVLDGTGHGPWIDRAEETNARILSFAAEVDGR